MTVARTGNNSNGSNNSRQIRNNSNGSNDSRQNR